MSSVAQVLNDRPSSSYSLPVRSLIMLTKQFKRRSSATEVLRQIGVPVRDYNLFIEPASEPGEVVLKLELAQKHAADLKVQTGEAPQPQKAPTHDVDLKVTSAPRKYVVNPKKIKYLETARGVQARAIIEVSGKAIAHFDDFPERLVADVHFSNVADRAQFLADARKAGFGETSDDHAIGEFARKLVHDVEARVLAEAEAVQKAKPESKPLKPTFPAAPKIKQPGKEVPAAKAPKTPKGAQAKKAKDKRTVTSVARELIIAGKTNEEVWDALVKEFKLDDGKKSYPAWY